MKNTPEENQTPFPQVVSLQAEKPPRPTKKLKLHLCDFASLREINSAILGLFARKPLASVSVW